LITQTLLERCLSSEGRNDSKESKREKEKKRLTNGTIDAIKSTIISSPFGLITSSSLNALPMVKLRNRSNSMLGLSASYPCIHQSIAFQSDDGIERKELSELSNRGVHNLVADEYEWCGTPIC
jgi:hypothetical protein